MTAAKLPQTRIDTGQAARAKLKVLPWRQRIGDAIQPTSTLTSCQSVPWREGAPGAREMT